MLYDFILLAFTYVITAYAFAVLGYKAGKNAKEDQEDQED